MILSFRLVVVGFVVPVKNIVVSGTRQGSCTILLVFSLVALASPSTQAHSLLRRSFGSYPPSETKKDTRLGVFSFLASQTGKDIAKKSDNLVFFILVGTAIIRSF